MQQDEGFRLFLIRKSIHLLFGIISIALLFWLPALAAKLLLSAASLFLIVDLLRRTSGRLRAAFLQIFGKLLKPSEVSGQITGATTFMIAVSGVSVTYPHVIVVASILILSISDSLASLGGRLFPVQKIRGEKSLTGSLTFFISCLMICWFLIPASFVMLIGAASVVTAIELIAPEAWENILIGFGSAAALLLIF